MFYWRLASALALATALAVTAGPSYADNTNNHAGCAGGAPCGAAGDVIDRSVVQQGFDASPIPKEKLNFKGKDPAMVGLGSYLVNSGADCNGCHTFPRFLRPAGPPHTPGNFTSNQLGLGSNPKYGNPYLDPVATTPDGFEPLNGQLLANTNADTSQVIGHSPNGAPIYKYNHFLAGGRCFGFFMSRNLTPDDSGMPRGLTEAEFIQVMRQGKDISCSKPNPPTYGGVPDPLCSPTTFPAPEAPGHGVTFNPDVLQTM